MQIIEIKVLLKNLNSRKNTLQAIHGQLSRHMTASTQSAAAIGGAAGGIVLFETG